jgi:hypothetical protein
MYTYKKGQTRTSAKPFGTSLNGPVKPMGTKTKPFGTCLNENPLKKLNFQEEVQLNQHRVRILKTIKEHNKNKMATKIQRKYRKYKDSSPIFIQSMPR